MSGSRARNLDRVRLQATRSQRVTYRLSALNPIGHKDDSFSFCETGRSVLFEGCFSYLHKDPLGPRPPGQFCF